MALNLLINGRVLKVQQADPYVMADSVADRIAGHAWAERARGWDERGEPARPLQRDAILALFDSGKLKEVQARAGIEVRLVYQAVTSVVAARTARYGETGCDGLSNADWPPSLKAAAQRYSAWADWARTQSVTPRLSLIELVQDVAIDDYGPSQVRRRRGIHDATVLRWLQKGLWRYALMAGWANELEHAA